jgi:hypothetical protein
MLGASIVPSVQGHPVVPNRPKSFSEARGQLCFQPVSDMLVVNIGQAGGHEARRVISFMSPYQGRENKIQACFETISPVLRRGIELGGV